MVRHVARKDLHVVLVLVLVSCATIKSTTHTPAPAPPNYPKALTGNLTRLHIPAITDYSLALQPRNNKLTCQAFAIDIHWSKSVTLPVDSDVLLLEINFFDVFVVSPRNLRSRVRTGQVTSEYDEQDSLRGLHIKEILPPVCYN